MLLSKTFLAASSLFATYAAGQDLISWPRDPSNIDTTAADTYELTLYKWPSGDTITNEIDRGYCYSWADGNARTISAYNILPKPSTAEVTVEAYRSDDWSGIPYWPAWEGPTYTAKAFTADWIGSFCVS